MRLALIGLAAVVAALAAGVQPGNAQFNSRYCSQGGGPGSSGESDCSFNTMAQCRATASGLGRYCTENSFGGGHRSGNWENTPRRKARRHHRRYH
jgi:hypothetical protein